MSQKRNETWNMWNKFVDTDYVKAVKCEARLMNDSGGKGSARCKKMYTEVRGKYAVQDLES